MYKDFNNYDVLPSGRIWSKSHKKFLKPKTTRDGYQQVCLTDNNGKLHSETLHKVVYFAVNGLWEYPEGMQINHIDEDKTNNHIDNLELVTPKQNCNHGSRTERAAKALGKRVGAFKNDELIMVFASINEAERNGFYSSAVCNCCRGKRKTHKGYEWKYLED